MKKATLFLLVGLMLASAGRLLAHEGHEHTIMGTVGAVEGNRIDVTTTDNQRATVWVDATTKYLRGKSETTKDDVKVGERVAIKATQKEGKMLASEVLLARPGKP